MNGDSRRRCVSSLVFFVCFSFIFILLATNLYLPIELHCDYGNTTTNAHSHQYNLIMKTMTNRRGPSGICATSYVSNLRITIYTNWYSCRFARHSRHSWVSTSALSSRLTHLKQSIARLFLLPKDDQHVLFIVRIRFLFHIN